MTENPYKLPTSQSGPLRPRKQSSLRKVAFILVLLAMFPASGIAFYMICMSVAENAPRGDNDFYGIGQLMTGLFAGVISGAVVFGLMLWWGVALSRTRFEKPRGWIKSDGTSFEAFFIAKDKEHATLRKVDGTEIRVPVYQLCDRDREWLDEME